MTIGSVSAVGVHASSIQHVLFPSHIRRHRSTARLCRRGGDSAHRHCSARKGRSFSDWFRRALPARRDQAAGPRHPYSVYACSQERALGEPKEAQGRRERRHACNLFACARTASSSSATAAARAGAARRIVLLRHAAAAARAVRHAATHAAAASSSRRTRRGRRGIVLERESGARLSPPPPTQASRCPASSGDWCCMPHTHATRASHSPPRAATRRGGEAAPRQARLCGISGGLVRCWSANPSSRFDYCESESNMIV